MEKSMNKLLLIPITFLILISVGQTNEVLIEKLLEKADVIYEDRLLDRNGVKYKVNTQTGYTGTGVIAHSNGNLKQKTSYKLGLRHGSFESYYKNGQLERKATYKDGKVHGSSVDYFSNGQWGIKAFFKDGNLDGPFVGSLVEEKITCNLMPKS